MPHHIPPELAAAMADMVRRYRPDLTPRRIIEILAEVPAPRCPTPMPEALTKAEVCRAGRWSLSTVNRLLRSGALPSRKVGRTVRIPRAAVEALLSEP
jgi:excisionase family DNA binding protein